MDPKHTLITSRPGGHRSESGLQRLETDAGEDVSVCGDAEMDRRPVHVESVRPPPVHVEYAAAIHQPEERNNNNKPQHSKKNVRTIENKNRNESWRQMSGFLSWRLLFKVLVQLLVFSLLRTLTSFVK